MLYSPQGSQRVGHDLATEQQQFIAQTEKNPSVNQEVNINFGTIIQLSNTQQ